MQTAVLLIAHGSRRPEANEDLARLAHVLEARRVYPIIEIAYLELAEPGIPEGARRCVERGAEVVKMLPYFLAEGQHVARDLEEFRATFAEQYPQVQFEMCAHLGLHPLMVEIVLDRLAGNEAGLR